MISNFHQSSDGPDENSSYYTFDEPSSHLSNKANRGKNGNKKNKRSRRIFGLGKSNKKKSAEIGDWRPPHMVDDNSTLTGQSLTYSTSAASYQTSGESTDSSGGAFGDILKLLDEEDAKEIKEKRRIRLYSSERSLFSSTSSLAYSEGGTTLNYSEDGDHSHLEGTKLLGMLTEPPEQPVGGSNEEGEIGVLYQSTPPAASKTPVMNNKSTSYRPTKNSQRGRRRKEREETEESGGDPVPSSRGNQSYTNRWFCEMDFGEAGTVLRPFFCF